MISKDNNGTGNKVNSPHDRFFKAMMVKPEINKDFLIANLPSHIKDVVDLDTIKFHKESFIDQQLQLKMVDILIETKFIDEPGYIYVLVEHQSNPDKLMPIRIWSYMLKIMEYHMASNKTDKPPIVYPIIFYTGERDYKYSTSLLDMFHKKDIVRTVIGEPPPIQLIPLNNISDEELAKHYGYCLLALAMKGINNSDSATRINILIKLLPGLNKDLISIIMHYTIMVRDIDDKDFCRIIDESDLPKDYKEEIMTLADRLEQKAIEKVKPQLIQQGIEEGRSKLIKQLIASGMTIEQVSNATKLMSTEIEQLLMIDVQR